MSGKRNNDTKNPFFLLLLWVYFDLKERELKRLQRILKNAIR